eukprot:COSAG01_NODE_485_length_16397_cov_48.193827_24_plen_57_part_00
MIRTESVTEIPLLCYSVVVLAVVCCPRGGLLGPRLPLGLACPCLETVEGGWGIMMP